MIPRAQCDVIGSGQRTNSWRTYFCPARKQQPSLDDAEGELSHTIFS